jgi:hypothetical protein
MINRNMSFFLYHSASTTTILKSFISVFVAGLILNFVGELDFVSADFFLCFSCLDFLAGNIRSAIIASNLYSTSAFIRDVSSQYSNGHGYVVDVHVKST